MGLNAQIIKTWIVTRTGLCAGDVLTDAIMQGAIDAALIEFSRHRSNEVFGSLAIVAQKTEYPFSETVNFPGNLRSISDVFYTSGSLILNNFSFDDILLATLQEQGVNLNFGGNIFENPSLVEVWFSKLRQYRDSIGLPDWRVIEGKTRTLQLMSNPTTDSTGYWEGLASWALSEILPEDYEVFIKAVMWKICDIRAMQLAVAKSYSEGGSGIRMEPAFDFWAKQSDKYEKQFLNDVGANRGIIHVG